MKVLCIAEKTWKNRHTSVREVGPKYGEICTVTGEYNDTHYFLAEYSICSDGTRAVYNKNAFILLSDKDETQYSDEVLKRMFQPVKF